MEGHSECTWSLAYLGTSGDIMSTSGDSSICQWKRDGEPIGKPLSDNGRAIPSMVVSPGEMMAICGSVDGRLRLMIGDLWERHNAAVRCLDWSRNSLEIANGSQDGTIRRWNPDTGRQIASPIKTSHRWERSNLYILYMVKGRIAHVHILSASLDETIRKWRAIDGQELIALRGHTYSVRSICLTPNESYTVSGSIDY
ncbi:WD40 repeat-like protein [Suillus hirtellus]|nr:WD40 repeat-like protein [Suillus hirtellus]